MSMVRYKRDDLPPLTKERKAEIVYIDTRVGGV